jgi:signal transduction histidine kinase
MNESDPELLQDRLNRAEQALERCERMAIASRHASAIMHEVNNHLEAITNLVYLIKLQADIPGQVTNNLESMDEQLEILGRITRQSLAFHRDQSEMKNSDLAEIARSALRLHADKILRHAVKVESHFADSAIAAVYEGEILQVISNLLLNALDALPSDNGRLSVQVKARRRSVQIVISDNGQGIPDDIAKNIFEPYVTSKPTGTGLGLWLSKRIIARHKGSLRFKTSRLEKKSGTSFFISLPTSIAV